VAMDLGWVTTLAAPDHPSAQITIVGGDDMAAPGITVEVPDVDAVHAIAVRRARPRDRLSPARRGLGGARAVLAEMIRALAGRSIPRHQREPLAELMSMGMAGLVLWWIEDATVSRAAVLDALTTAWARLLA
jgi:hypothetical protein